MSSCLLKNLFFSILGFLFFGFTCCKGHEAPVINIKGIISNAPPHLVFISKYYLDDRQELIIDSIKVDHLDQNFNVIIPYIKDSNSLLKLNIGRNALFLFLDDTIGSITLKVNLNDLGSYDVTGPLSNILFRKINYLLRPFQDSLYLLTNFINNSTDPVLRKKFIDQTVSIKERQHRLMKSFLDTCNAPKVALKLMYDMDFSKDPGQLKQLITHLDDRFGSYPAIRKYVIESNNYIRIIEQEFMPGDTIPDLILKLKGKPPASLSQMLKEKNLLVFWASYCTSCIQQLLKVDKLKAFKDSSTHRIIGFSLDVDSTSYESSLHEIPMIWPQAYDFKGWRGSIANHFLIDSIPMSILVDKHMKVLAVDVIKSY